MENNKKPLPITITVEQDTHRKMVVLNPDQACVDTLNKTWSIRQAITLAGRNVIAEVCGETGWSEEIKTDEINAALLNINGSPVTDRYSIRRKQWYEVVRIANDGNDHEEFDKISKWNSRGWNKKILRHLTQWDNGAENYGTAKHFDKVWDTPTDPRENDRVLTAEKNYVLCHAYSGFGIYEAFYLVCECNHPIR